MAGNRFKVSVSGISSGTAAKTVLYVKAASNIGMYIDEWSISFAGTSNTQVPILVELLRFLSDGTASAVTPAKDPSDTIDALQFTAAQNATVEPMAGDVLMREYVHPQTGYTWQAPFGRAIKVNGGTRLGIRVTSAVDTTLSCRMSGEE